MEIDSGQTDQGRSQWWLWRMSDRTLLPVHRDEEGIDWPFLGDERVRSLEVDLLLRSGAPVSEQRPNLHPGALGAVSVGPWPFVALLAGLLMRFAPAMPEAVRVVGGLGWLLIPAAVAALVGHRRVRSLPDDLREVAREEVRDVSTRIRVRPWIAWASLLVLVLLLGLMFATRA